MDKIFNQEQVKGMFERFATIIATWLLLKLVRSGLISTEDSTILAPGLVILIVATPSLFYGWWVNRGKALAQATVKAMGPDTIVVTDKYIADATTESNIVSNQTSSVVVKADVVTKPAQVVVDTPNVKP